MQLPILDIIVSPKYLLSIYNIPTLFDAMPFNCPLRNTHNDLDMEK